MKVANRQRVACSPGLLCRCCGRRTGHTTSPGRRGEARPTPLSPRRKFIVRRLERCALNDRRKFGPPPNVFMRASGDGRDGDGGLSWKGGRQERLPGRTDGRSFGGPLLMPRRRSSTHVYVMAARSLLLSSEQTRSAGNATSGSINHPARRPTAAPPLFLPLSYY